MMHARARDVSIKVFNHADGELHDLVVGLSVGSVL